MKKLSMLFIALLIFITGCTRQDAIENQPMISTLTIQDYYPFRENLLMQYIGVNNEFSEKRIFTEFSEGNRIQIKTTYNDYSMVRVLEYENGELREIYSEDKFYHIENVLRKDKTMNNILLKEPLEVGNSWETHDGYTRTITGDNVDIDTPYGNLKALEVTTKFGEGKVQKDYYAAGIGYVGTVYVESGFEIKTLLEKVEEGPLKMDIRFYYPTIDGRNSAYVNREIEFETNGNITDILEYNMKNPQYDELLAVIAEDTDINSIVLDKGKEIVRIDFSNEIAADVDTEMEIEILKSIVNTIGSFYKVENVHISINGEPYSSESFMLGEDDFFSVDYMGIEEFKETNQRTLKRVL